MKKKTLLSMLIVAIVSIGSVANAQVRFGIRGDVGLNTPSFKEEVVEVENLNSFRVGPTIEVMLPIIDLGIEGALLYSNDRMNVKNLDNSQGTSLFDEKISNHYIDVPLNLKYKFGGFLPVSAYVAAGPFVRVLVSEGDFWNEVRDQVEANSFAAGINAGAGVELFHRFAVGANYFLKLTDDYSVQAPGLEDILNEKKGVWSLTATVYF